MYSNLFQSVFQMVVTNLDYYLSLLVSKKPLFTVETLLSAPEIVLHPHANELLKIMMVAMREVVDRYHNGIQCCVYVLYYMYYSTRRFPRWLDGSCIEAQPKPIPGQDQPYTYTFFTDVTQHPDVNAVGLAVREAICTGIQTIVNHIGLWKRYRLLWRVQRVWLKHNVLLR